MNRFTADYSSSPANTPPRSRDLFFNEPNIASTTPLVPPPSTVFGSSRLGTGKTLFANQKSSTTNSYVHHSPPNQRARRLSPRQPKVDARFAPPANFEDDGGENDDLGFEEDDQPPARSLMQFSTNSAKPSRKSVFRRTTHSRSILPQKGNPDVVTDLARNIIRQQEPAPLEKEDAIILDTELFLQHLNAERGQASDPATAQEALEARALELLNLWRANVTQAMHMSADIGPPTSAPAFDKAYYISSLLFAVHHPTTRTIPEAILGWLQKHHVSYDSLAQAVVNCIPNATAHDMFWDAVLSLTLRGRLHGVMRLLQDADFQYAVTALDDGEEEPGFHGAQLQTIQSIIYKVRQVINACPALNDNWDTTSDDWAMYRSNVEMELDSLGQMASGEQGDEDDFEAANFGVRKPQRELLRKSQRSRNLPWSIYQGIRVLYGILIGSTTEIISQSQDWLEASCALTVWWDGASDAKIANWSLDVGRATRTAPQESTTNPYLTRMRDAFLCVTDPKGQDTFSVNGMSSVEIGLSCALQGSVSSALGVMFTLSQCTTDATAEFASIAGWLNNGAYSGLDQTDLLVLSSVQPNTNLSKDDILLSYANALSERGQLGMSNGTSAEGWEIAMSVLSRLDDQEAANEAVSELFEQFDIGDEDQAQRLIGLCMDLRFNEQARVLSERLGDHLSHNTTKYGMALLCYARSHNAARVQQLTEMLISYCLVQSRAWPADGEADVTLLSLVESPKIAFANMMDSDPEAASVLQFYVVGYACVRKLFSYRDHRLSSEDSSSRVKTESGGKRVAAKALVAAINSAADSIYGGLYDADRQTAVQVDALMPLLGEATALLAQDGSQTFSNEQIYALLAAIEDLETVTSRVREATEACLLASMEEYRGNQPPSPRAMLSKSMSSGTNSNFSFSMMGSGMLESATSGGGGRSEGSGVLVGRRKPDGIERGWDWRSAFKDVASEDLMKEVLRRLRLGLAQELSLGQLEA